MYNHNKLSFAILIIILFYQSVSAQVIKKERALELLTNNQRTIGLINPEGAISTEILNAYTDPNKGITYMYIQERYMGIKVHNLISTLIFKNNILQSQNGNLVLDIEKKANSSIPAISAFDAVYKAAAHLKLPEPISLTDLSNKFESNAINQPSIIKFSAGGIAKQPITAELVWVSNDDNNTFQLSWNISIDVLTTPDYWNVNVNAENGNIISKGNYTVYEQNNTKALNFLLKKTLPK